MILFSQSDRGQIATDCGDRQARRGLGDPRISGPLNGSQAESSLGRFQAEKAENQNALENSCTSYKPCRVKGPRKARPQGGGGMGWGFPSLLPTPPSLSRASGGESTNRLLCQGLPSVWGGEQPLYSELPPPPPHASPNSNNPTGQLCLGTFWLGDPGRGPHRGTPSLRALPAALFGTSCSPRPPISASFLHSSCVSLFFDNNKTLSSLTSL